MDSGLGVEVLSVPEEEDPPGLAYPPCKVRVARGGLWSSQLVAVF